MNWKKSATRVGLSVLVLVFLAGSLATGMSPHGVRSLARTLTYGYDPEQIRPAAPYPRPPRIEPNAEDALADSAPMNPE